MRNFSQHPSHASKHLQNMQVCQQRIQASNPEPHHRLVLRSRVNTHKIKSHIFDFIFQLTVKKHLCLHRSSTAAFLVDQCKKHLRLQQSSTAAFLVDQCNLKHEHSKSCPAISLTTSIQRCRIFGGSVQPKTRAFQELPSHLVNNILWWPPKG